MGGVNKTFGGGLAFVGREPLLLVTAARSKLLGGGVVKRLVGGVMLLWRDPVLWFGMEFDGRDTLLGLGVATRGSLLRGMPL